MNRKQILDALSVVKPAVAPAGFYIPLLSMVMFTEGRVVGFNDISAISTSCEGDLSGCVVADKLMKVLQSFKSDDVEIKRTNYNFIIKSDKATVRIPCVDTSSFPIASELASGVPEYSFKLTEEIISGLEMCLINVGKDSAHPAQMGVTLLFSGKGSCYMYSSDNVSMSRYVAAVKETSVPDKILFPTFFCKQLVSLYKNVKELDVKISIYPGSVVATSKSMPWVFSRLIEVKSYPEFESTFERYFKDDYRKPIPSGFEECIERACVLHDEETRTLVNLSSGGQEFQVRMKSISGETSEVLKWKPYYAFDVDVSPLLLRRSLPWVQEMAIYKNVVILYTSDLSFIHLVAVF